MSAETKEQISRILQKVAILTAACEGNMLHDPNITTESIYNAAVEIQSDLLVLSGK